MEQEYGYGLVPSPYDIRDYVLSATVTDFANLPEEFDYQAYQHVAQSLNIPARTASTYISELCKSGSIIRLKKGHY